MRIVTYHTGGRYADAAQQLQAGAAARGLTVEVHALPDRGDWWLNVAHKPALLAKLRAEGGGPLLYVDADCRIEGDLDDLPQLLRRADLAVLPRPEGWGTRYNGGVMLFGDGASVRAMLRLWAALTEQRGRRYATCDQPLLDVALARKPLRVRALPERYNRMRGDGDAARERPAIVHVKASRAEGDAFRRRRDACLLAERLTAAAAQVLEAERIVRRSVVIAPAALVPRVAPRVEVHAVGWSPAVVRPPLRQRYVPPTWVWAPVADLAAWCKRGGDTRLWVPVDAQGLATLQARFGAVPATLPERLYGFWPGTTQRDFLLRELGAADPWRAALHAAALRGAQRVGVYGLPRLPRAMERMAVDLEVDLQLWSPT